MSALPELTLSRLSMVEDTGEVWVDLTAHADRARLIATFLFKRGDWTLDETRNHENTRWARKRYGQAIFDAALDIVRCSRRPQEWRG